MTTFALAPALPLHAAGKYVAAAYIVFVVVILIYVMIMAVRLSRTERALVELNGDIAKRDAAAADPAESAARDDVRPPGLDREPAPAGRGPGDSSL
ncbi:MAG TPA: hypothetical protein VG294_16195 [Solirubrobacteraceae bacterium]|jgi:hypothetical protein|nr:hypothetical protein [Solirubrobacteraceae bacterium]